MKRDAKGMYLSAIFNAIMPEQFDADVLTEENYSQNTLDNISNVVSSYPGFADLKEGESMDINTDTYKEQFKSEGGFFDPKRETEFLLGNFKVNRTKDGVRIEDYYDTGSAESDDVTIEKSGFKHWAAKKIGHIVAPENEDGTSKDPEASNTIKLDLFIPMGGK